MGKQFVIVVVLIRKKKNAAHQMETVDQNPEYENADPEYNEILNKITDTNEYYVL